MGQAWSSANCCWPGWQEKILEWDAILFGRMERHNPEGKGPNGKVGEDHLSRKNQEDNPDQEEDYNGLMKHLATDATFNPNALTIKPKVKEEKIKTDDPDEEAMKLEGTIRYKPQDVPSKIDESHADKIKRIYEAQIKQKSIMDKIRLRCQDDSTKLMGNVGGFLKNIYTNNKHIPAPKPKSKNDQGNRKSVDVEGLGSKKSFNPEIEKLRHDDARDPVTPTPEDGNNHQHANYRIQIGSVLANVKFSLGEPPKQIPGLVIQSRDVFDEGRPNEAKYASHDIVVPNCSWQKVHKQINGEYYDLEFPAEKESLQGHGSLESDSDNRKLETMRNYHFKRLSYVLEGVKVVDSGISPNDIYQGQLGDCYYLSSLSAVAEHPDRIDRLLMQKETSEKGAYCVALNILGQWILVIIDDIFPVSPSGGVPFCYTKTKEIWAMLMEKAYAKVYGGYWNIGCGGLTSDAMTDITGAPCSYIDLKDEEELKTALKTIEDADKQRFIITCSSMGSGENKGDNGIISGHAYTLVSVVRLSDGTELLKLRNPWGSGEWKGDWGDGSDKWEMPGSKEQAGWNSEDDGLFFMRFEDFCQNFAGVTICHYHDDYILSTVKSDNQDEQMDVKQFSVHQTGSYYIGLSQPDKKHFSKECEYDFGYLSCAVLKKLNDGNFMYIDGFSYSKRDIWAKMELDAGSYIAIIYTNWNSANTQYSFWTYGPKNAVIKGVYDESCKDKCLDYLYNALIKDALSKTEGWTNMKSQAYSAIRYKFEYSSTGYGYYIFDNPVDSVTLTATVKMEAENCMIIRPHSDDNAVELVLEPHETKMVLYKIVNLPNSVGFSIGFKMKKSWF